MIKINMENKDVNVELKGKKIDIISQLITINSDIIKKLAKENHKIELCDYINDKVKMILKD